jgi:hypothetical protein
MSKPVKEHRTHFGNEGPAIYRHDPVTLTATAGVALTKNNENVLI